MERRDIHNFRSIVLILQQVLHVVGSLFKVQFDIQGVFLDGEFETTC